MGRIDNGCGYGCFRMCVRLFQEIEDSMKRTRSMYPQLRRIWSIWEASSSNHITRECEHRLETSYVGGLSFLPQPNPGPSRVANACKGRQILLGMARNFCLRNSSSNQFSTSVEEWKPGPGPGVVNEEVECVVIGAGVVGLAIARALARRGREVLVVEAAGNIGTGTSSRNSEVIHAGIYYPPGSNKAKQCVAGKKALYEYCEEKTILHKRVGKLIVATGLDQIPVLEKLMSVGKANGVEDLRMISGYEAQSMEPALCCVQALFSPSTGIVDSHALMQALKTDAEELGVLFAFNSTIVSGTVTVQGIQIGVCDSSSLARKSNPSTSRLEDEVTLSTKIVVNAAGLHAQSVARRFKGLLAETVPRAYYARGCYFSLKGVRAPPFSHLIYPVPEDGGIGVHVTMDLQGQTRFGPDVEWLTNLDGNTSQLIQFDYNVDLNRGDKFYPEVRKYYPALSDGALQPDYAGIRPKLSGRGQPPEDFLIQGEEKHGVRGLINLYGIESPGLTSSLGLAVIVEKLLCQ